MDRIIRFAGFVMVGLASATVTGVICELGRRNKMMKRLLKVSNEGYETAPDIVYPNRLHEDQPDDLKYGPYIPKYF